MKKLKLIKSKISLTEILIPDLITLNKDYNKSEEIWFKTIIEGQLIIMGMIKLQILR